MIFAGRFFARSRSVARSGNNPMNQNSADTVAYVDTAKASHTRGLRKFGHIFIVSGYGKSQYASQGRPMWINGKIPAQETAKSVMASANRLMEVRHCCRNSRRIAEISVPACPIPIHQTKLMIAKPHATGIWMPQIPVPTAKRYAIPYSNNIIRANAPTKPKTHHLGGRRFRTMKLILSVTEA